jgi:hypothetical protein
MLKYALFSSNARKTKQKAQSNKKQDPSEISEHISFIDLNEL